MSDKPTKTESVLWTGNQQQQKPLPYIPRGQETASTRMNGQSMNAVPLAEYLRLKKGMI